jgi:predicted nucleic acid-binding Zn ribbon protein
VPIYTYECSAGHQWDEVRGLAEETEVSQDACEACMEALTHDEYINRCHERSHPHGRKVVTQVSVKLSGKDWTPKFYTNRKGK